MYISITSIIFSDYMYRTGISYILDRLPKDLEELRATTAAAASAPNVLQLFEIIQEFSHRIIRHDKLPMCANINSFALYL